VFPLFKRTRVKFSESLEIPMMIAVGLAALVLVFQIQWTWLTDDALMREWSAPNGPHSGSVVSFLNLWLRGWSSRIAIGGAWFIFVNHLVWWRILTACAFWLVIVLPAFLIERNRVQRQMLIPVSALLLLSIPSVVWFDAGLVATTVNYLWVLAAGMLAALPAVFSFQGRSFSPLWYAVTLLTGFYAGSFEIGAPILFAIYVFILGRSLYLYRNALRNGEVINRGQITVFAIFALLFLAMVIWHLTSPGNAARGMGSWFSPMFGILVERSYSSTLRQIFMSRYLIPLAFFVLVAWRNYRKSGWSLFTFISLVPIAGSLLLRDAHFPGLMGERITSLFRGGNLLWDTTGPEILHTAFPLNLAAILLLTIMLAAAITAIWGAQGWGGKLWILLAILGAGFASKFIVVNTLGLALDNDFHRTDLFLLYAFVFAILVLLTDDASHRQSLPLQDH
jgi:hypothetical protein